MTKLHNNKFPLAQLPSCNPLKILYDKKAIVTGTNSKIGKDIALELAKADADVAVNFVTSPEFAKEVVDELRKCGVKSFTIQVDVSNEEQVN